MKLQAEIDGEICDVEVRIDDGGTYARVGDREYELEVSEPEPGVYMMKRDGRITEVATAVQDDHVEVTIRGERTDVRLIDPKQLRGSGRESIQGDGLIEIKTAMPGKIVRVLARAGMNVAKGDGIVVVEAMKMQNEMRSPKDGVVKEIRVAEADTVNAGHVLAVIE